MEELNKKLAEWLFPLPEYRVEGIYSRFIAIDSQFTQEARDYILSQDPTLKGGLKVGEWYRWENIPILTGSLDACFKWLVPKLPNNLGISIGKDGDRPYFYCRIEGAYFDSIRLVKTAETPALALCKAIEKLIDNEEAR